MIVLTKKQILAMHGKLASLTGGASGIREEALLDSALEQPFQAFGGEDLYPTVQAKAARLAFGLAKNHALLDGNKRIACHSMLVFLALNGVELDYSQQELSDTFFALASGTLDEAGLLKWILQHQKE